MFYIIFFYSSRTLLGWWIYFESRDCEKKYLFSSEVLVKMYCFDFISAFILWFRLEHKKLEKWIFLENNWIVNFWLVTKFKITKKSACCVFIVNPFHWIFNRFFHFSRVFVCHYCSLFLFFFITIRDRFCW